ncbi:MAG TPA: hypothetical protein VGK47_01710 [Nitrososphaeraceae archaeon]
MANHSIGNQEVIVTTCLLYKLQQKRQLPFSTWAAALLVLN